MKQITFLNKIVDEFGGDDKEKLKNLLIKLVEKTGGDFDILLPIKIKSELEIDLFELEEPHEKTVQYEDITYYIDEDSLKNSLENILNCGKHHYIKLLMLISAFHEFPGWHSVKMLPNDFAREIMSFDENHKYGVYFDPYKDYLEFKVE